MTPGELISASLIVKSKIKPTLIQFKMFTKSKMRNQRLHKASFTTLLIYILCLLTATSCRKTFDIELEQSINEPPLFHMGRKDVSSNQGIAISSFSIYRKGRDHLERVWSFATLKNKDGILLKTVTYGVVPDGFENCMTAKPLIKGETYEILASTPGGASGAAFLYTGATFNTTHSQCTNN